jgi:hypothetical protein
MNKELKRNRNIRDLTEKSQVKIENILVKELI